MNQNGNSIWTATRFKHLYRHKSGRYYARLTIAGKKTWRSLGTKLLNVAQHELTELLAEEGKRAELHEAGIEWKNI